MAGAKISVDAAMRARDVSQPYPDQIASAERTELADVASAPAQQRSAPATPRPARATRPLSAPADENRSAPAGKQRPADVDTSEPGGEAQAVTAVTDVAGPALAAATDPAGQISQPEAGPGRPRRRGRTRRRRRR